MKLDFLVTDYGAKPGLDFNSTAAFQAAVNDCNAQGGGRVVVPTGEWLVDTVTLLSYVDFYVSPGAKIVTNFLGTEGNRAPLFYAENAEHFSITGRGRIEGQSHLYMTETIQYHSQGTKGRPKIMVFIGCSFIQIRDLTIENAPIYTIHPIGCKHILIDCVNIHNDTKLANCDGIDPDHCVDVRISNCDIRCADDCIVLKNTKEYTEYGDCRDIVITNCRLMSTSAGFKLGSETNGHFENIIVSDCVFHGCNRAIGLQLRDGGSSMENLLFQNLTIQCRNFYPMYWGKGDPITISNLPRHPDTVTGTIKNIRFSNIIMHGEGSVFVQGTKPGDIQNVTFSDIYFDLKKTSKWANGTFDRQPATVKHGTLASIIDPCGLPDHKYLHMFQDKVNYFRIEMAEDITLRNVTARFLDEQPYYGAAIRTMDVKNLAVYDCDLAPSTPDGEIFQLENTTIAPKPVSL